MNRDEKARFRDENGEAAPRRASPSGRPNDRDEKPHFWHEALSLRGAPTLVVLPRVLAFGAFSTLIYLVDKFTPHYINLAIEPTPFGVAGTILGLLLVLRANAGYDRWWEGRKLWGGIVNQSRGLTIATLAYGPDDADWRGRVVRWTVAFSHVARAGLRGERDLPSVASLLGEAEAARIAAAPHMPTFVLLTLADLIREGRDRLGMDPFAFLQADRERALLVDDIGGCERIKKAPLPKSTSTLIRQFIVLYLGTLPFALLHSLGQSFLVPLLTMAIAFPILALDQAAFDLQDPFARRNLSRLPLDEICRGIERDLLALLEAAEGAAPGDEGRPAGGVEARG